MQDTTADTILKRRVRVLTAPFLRCLLRSIPLLLLLLPLQILPGLLLLIPLLLELEFRRFRCVIVIVCVTKWAQSHKGEGEDGKAREIKSCSLATLVVSDHEHFEERRRAKFAFILYR
jgi:hypothetical protein